MEVVEGGGYIGGEVVEGDVEATEGGDLGEGVWDGADDDVFGEVDVAEATTCGEGGGGDVGVDLVVGEGEVAAETVKIRG